jgi:hypothetical protein
MRIRIQLITLNRVQILILPFNLMRIRIHNTAAWALKKLFSTGVEVTTFLHAKLQHTEGFTNVGKCCHSAMPNFDTFSLNKENCCKSFKNI